MVGERFTCGGLEKDSHVHDSNTIIIKHHVLFVLFCFAFFPLKLVHNISMQRTKSMRKCHQLDIQVPPLENIARYHMPFCIYRSF